MKKFVFITLICLYFGLNIFAQAKIKVLKYEAPKGSPAVFAIGLKGEFEVNVKIRTDGKVITTDVGKIHPLLKEVLEDAASKWLFSADKNSEERNAKIVFEYKVKPSNSKIIVDEPPKITTHFKKPFHLIITAEIYPRTRVY